MNIKEEIMLQLKACGGSEKRIIKSVMERIENDYKKTSDAMGAVEKNYRVVVRQWLY